MSDYISREAAKMAVVEATNKCYSPYNAIVMLPAADVVERELYAGASARADNFESALKDLVEERKTGKWIPRILLGNYKAKGCSECHALYGDYLEWNFCPNCGCDMRQKDGE